MYSLNDWYLRIFIELKMKSLLWEEQKIWIQFFNQFIFVTKENLDNSQHCPETDSNQFKLLGLINSDKD